MAYTQSINTETKLIGELGLNNLISSTAGLSPSGTSLKHHYRCTLPSLL